MRGNPDACKTSAIALYALLPGGASPARDGIICRA
jgi:hypothetical protein